MTNAEIIAIIRAEIERRITDNTFGAKLELIDILAWLDTLESEKPMNQEELEKEIIDVDVLDKEFYRYLKIHGLSIQKGERITYYNGDTPNLLFDLKSIVCHFYNFGCFRTAEKYDEIEYNRQRAEESVQKDLEEAANNYASVTDPEAHGIDFIREVFIAGAEWQKEQDEKEQADLFTIVALDAAQRAKEQMLKEAVDVEVESFTDMQSPEVTIPLNPTIFKVGDKVRVIIIKE